MKTIMDNLFSVLQSNRASIKLDIQSDDLMAFSRDLVERTRHELAAETAAASKEDKLLTKEEVKAMFGVCDATLWHWARKNYLPAIKIGSKVRYRESDVLKILSNGK